MTPTLDHLIISACEFKHISRYLVLSKSRRKRLVDVRNLIVWNARHYGYTFPEIGSALNRDHTTIIYSAKKTGAV